MESPLPAIKEFYECHGHSDYRRGGSGGGDSLARWVNRIRQGWDRLSEEKRKKLLAIKFRHRIQQILRRERFEKMLLALRAFRRKYDHCRVPQGWPTNPGLGAWVQALRGKQGKLSPERRRILDRLGFDWSPTVNQWQKRYVQLRGYQKVHGYGSWPSRRGEDASLEVWLTHNCRLWRKGKLSPDKISKLKALGMRSQRRGKGKWIG